jgi:hypothetical protein
MRDIDLRGEVLKVLYDARSTHPQFNFGALASHVTAHKSDVARICDQLAQSNLIKWVPARAMGGIVIDGMASISADGVDVIEETRQAPISITLHDRRITVSGSTNVQIGDSNSIQANINLSKIMEAIDQSSASPAQKEEAKSLWSKLTNNAAFAAIVGAVMTMAGSGAAH